MELTHPDDLARLGAVETFKPNLDGVQVRPQADRDGLPEQTLPRFRAFGLHEFTALKFPPRDYVLSPILPLKGTAMLYAARGVGKTHVGLGAAYAVAAGASFLRWRAPKPRKVFYIDGEMPGQALQERLIAVGRCDAATPSLDAHLRILPMDAQDLGTSIRLRRRGMSVLLIHHAGRGENARGTSKREDILDTVIHLKRPSDYQIEEGARFEVHLTKCRGVFGDDAAPFEAKMEIRNDATCWTVREMKDVQADQVAAMTRDNMTVREIADELGISKSTVNRIQNRLKELGRFP